MLRAGPLLPLLLPLLAAAESTSACTLDPALPQRLAAHASAPLCAGFLDPTQPPYSARADGTTDDSAALQAALDDAYLYHMAVLLPAGRSFAVARQLRAVQRAGLPCNRERGYQLVGERGAAPPVLRVLDGADPAAFPTIYTSKSGYVAKPVVQFALNRSGVSNDAPSHYSAMLRNVDIDLGDNPQLSGVSMSGAQLCSIEDVRVTGVRFTAGFVGLPGSGGYSANIRATGGQFAVWQQQFRPNPSIVGLVAVNQTVAAVLVESARGPLVISGFAIRTSAASATAGVMTTCPSGGDGSLSLEDGVIAMEGPASGAPAVSTAGADVALKDLWVQTPAAVELAGRGALLRSTAGATKKIPRWWFGAASPHGAAASASIAYLNGANVSAQALNGFPALDLRAAPPVAAPGDTAVSTRHSWTREAAQALAWSGASPGAMLDAVRDCGATPSWVNSTDDDGAAISRCLQLPQSRRGGVAVFVPRGEFLLWAPLVLRPGQKLVGAGKHCATLMMRPGPSFDAAPLVQVEGASAGWEGAANTSVLSDLVLATAQRGTILAVDAADALVRDVRTTPCTTHASAGSPTCAQPPPPAGGAGASGRARGVPAAAAGVRFTGGASGRFYGLCLDHFAAYLVAGDALLAASGAMAGGGVHLYQLSAEHLATDYQVKVRDASGVHLHAFKFESAGFLAHPTWGPPGGGLFSCHSSTNVSIFGGSGNCGIMNASLATAIILAEDCALQLSAVVRKPVPGETPAPEALWIRSVARGSGGAIEVSDRVPAVLAFS